MAFEHKSILFNDLMHEAIKIAHDMHFDHLSSEGMYPVLAGGDLANLVQQWKDAGGDVTGMDDVDKFNLAHNGYALDALMKDDCEGARLEAFYVAMLGGRLTPRQVLEGEPEFHSLLGLYAFDVGDGMDIPDLPSYSIDDLVQNGNPTLRMVVARMGDGLKELVKDENPLVRLEVAKLAYGMHLLVKDPDPRVRAEVAHQGYGLKCLINDPSPCVRAAVAEAGYGLDMLAKDPDVNVRNAVAKAGYHLQCMLDDADAHLRLKAIQNGYCKPELLKDACEAVRLAALDYYMSRYGEQMINLINALKGVDLGKSAGAVN